MTPPPRVSAVIPTLNEAGNVGWVLGRLPAIVDEVIIVDGLSTDGTIEAAIAARPDVVVVRTEQRGKGAALQAGFAAARGAIIVMLDADCSMDPAEIERFIARMRPGVDLVKGSRFLPGAATTDITPFRRLGNGALLALVNRMYGEHFTDLCYGFCVFRRAALEGLGIDAVGFEVETQIVVRAVLRHLRIEEAPSLESPRHDGASKLRPCRDGMRVLWTIADEHRRAHNGHVTGNGGVSANGNGGRPVPRRIGATLAAALVPLLALLVWALSLRKVNPDTIGATGLVSVLPALAFVGLGALTVSFCVNLGRSRTPTWLLVAHVAALVVMLYGLGAAVEPEPAFEPAYRHVGIAGYIAQTGGLNTSIDAYFNWPGFFIVVAFLSRVAGLHDALSLVPWAPLAYNLLYLAPLLVILRALTSDRRLIFLGLWLFYATNWTAQDYFSPQAAAYLLYLVVIAILLRWFTPPVERTTAGRRAAVLAIAIAACAAIVSMHQLTPFAVLASMTALVLFAGCTTRLLPILMAALIGGWAAFLAIGFMDGNLSGLVSGVGALGGTLHSNLGARIGGDPGHRFVVDTRLALTGAIATFALMGWWDLRRRGTSVRAATVLGLAPFPLLGLQSYGGEILIRVWLFALPFAAYFAAAGMVAIVAHMRAVRLTPALAGATAVLLAGFLFARYGNDRMDAFSRGDVEGVQALYRIAPPGSELVAASQPLPWQSRDYASYDYQRLTTLLPGPPPSPDRPHLPLTYRIRDVLRTTVPGRAFIIVTRSQVAGDELVGTGGTPTSEVEQRLSVSRIFHPVYRGPDAEIWALRSRSGASA